MFDNAKEKKILEKKATRNKQNQKKKKADFAQIKIDFEIYQIHFLGQFLYYNHTGRQSRE